MMQRMYDLTTAWPSRVLPHDEFKLPATVFWPTRHCGLPLRRDPAHDGVCCTSPVESSLLHCSGTNELQKEGTFHFQPALVNIGGSITMLRYFRACVNFFSA